MPVLEKLNIGIVGAVGRGASFSAALEANGARLQAVCDLNREKLEENPAFAAAEKYTAYEDMLEHAALDAVIVGTPQQLHAAQAGQALERGLHVLSEVPAAVSIEEARRLVQAASAARSIYMLAENYNYFKGNILVRELVRQGLFGEVYYAEGEYLHNVRSYIPRTPWRRHWQMGIDGNTYPTHELGPILSWMPGDRVARLACEGSGRHYADPDGQPLHQDTSLMVCKTARGALIKIRLDLVSERPELVRFQLQGTHGVYESEPWGGGFDRIWLRGLSQKVKWLDAAALAQIDTLAEKYLPDWWRHPPEAALKAGHDGGDFFVLMDFLAAARGEQPSPLDIHAAMDMTLPGLVSQQSICSERRLAGCARFARLGRAAPAHGPAANGLLRGGPGGPRPAAGAVRLPPAPVPGRGRSGLLCLDGAGRISTAGRLSACARCCPRCFRTVSSWSSTWRAVRWQPAPWRSMCPPSCIPSGGSWAGWRPTPTTAGASWARSSPRRLPGA